jgi:voltage-gated potassium channel
MEQLRHIVEDPETPAGRAFALTIQALIVYSLITFSIETVPDLSAGTRRFLAISEAVVVVIFTVEYLLRVAVTRPRLGYICSFFGLVDLLAILPFYLSTGIDLRSLRVLRFLRLVRILKLARYGDAARRFKQAYCIVREELFLFIGMTAILLYLSAVGIYYFERAAQPEAFGSVFHCLWWAVSSLTTVGYGDVFPITTGGRIFTSFVLLLGLGVIAVPAGLFASALSRVRGLERQESP